MDAAILAYGKELKERIDIALEEVTAAEAALEVALSELRSGVRAEKVRIPDALEQAFVRLRAGRIELARLRALVAAA